MPDETHLFLSTSDKGIKAVLTNVLKDNVNSFRILLATVGRTTIGPVGFNEMQGTTSRTLCLPIGLLSQMLIDSKVTDARCVNGRVRRHDCEFLVQTNGGRYKNFYC